MLYCDPNSLHKKKDSLNGYLRSGGRLLKFGLGPLSISAHVVQTFNPTLLVEVEETISTLLYI